MKVNAIFKFKMAACHVTYAIDFDNFGRQMFTLSNGVIGEALACLVSEEKNLEEGHRPSVKLKCSKLQRHLAAKR
mgnify:CR=1 FL=1